MDKKDIYQRITDQIIAQMEKGEIPWRKPWDPGQAVGRITRPLRATGQPYQGVNIILLWSAAEERGYDNPNWMTYKQATDLGGQVRKGEKSTIVTYSDTFVPKGQEVTEGEEPEKRWFLKTYLVFNAQQIDGLPERFYGIPPALQLDPIERIAGADAFFKNTGADIREGGGQAFYSGSSDHIQMPPFQTFESPEAYYATLGHEAIHWTKHPSRLDRDLGRKKWGDEGYAREELVADLGAAFTMATLGIAPEPREEHAAYIQNWLKVLQNDKRAIVSAASMASKAADYLQGLQPAIAADAEAAIDDERQGFAARLTDQRQQQQQGRAR